MCSYCGCRSLAVIGRLSAEHETIINVMGELRRAHASGDSPQVANLADRLASLLDPHTRSEEQGLFAELREQPEFTEAIEALAKEHVELDTALREIIAGRPSEITAFETLLRRHIDREENGLFPAAATALGGDSWDRLAALG